MFRIMLTISKLLEFLRQIKLPSYDSGDLEGYIPCRANLDQNELTSSGSADRVQVVLESLLGII